MLSGIKASSARCNGAGTVLKCMGLVTRRCIHVPRGPKLETRRNQKPVSASGEESPLWPLESPPRDPRSEVSDKPGLERQNSDPGSYAGLEEHFKRPEHTPEHKRFKESSEDTRTPPELKPRMNIYHPSLFTITTPYPNQVTKHRFLQWLSVEAKRASANPRTYVDARNIVILTTPTFSTWIEDSDFVGRMLGVLNQKYWNIKHIQTTAAVVDGLFPPTQLDASSPVAQSAEGFSFMITQDSATAARPEAIKAIRDLSAELSSSSGLRLNFVRSRSDVRRGNSKRPSVIEVTVPLANTLFRNGRKSTLVVGNWVNERKSKDDKNLFRATSMEYKETSAVRTEGFQVGANIDFPLDKLTKPRRIIAGLGNIVRQLEGDSGEPLPASTELEESVVSYLTAKKLPQQQVSVWAMVVPEEEMVTHQKRFPDNLVPWHLLRDSRAGLHRVLSGGGGWGSKAGLLSLDPEVTAPASMESPPDDDFAAFQSRFAEVDEQTQALGDIAKPGSYVWFLIAKEGLVDENGKLASLSSTDGPFAEENGGPLTSIDEKDAYKRIRLGCIRSTIDDVPAAVQAPSRKLLYQHNVTYEFGAQSELGLYARIRELAVGATIFPTESTNGKDVAGETFTNSAKSWEVKNASKIDVPGAMFSAFFKESNGRSMTKQVNRGSKSI